MIIKPADVDDSLDILNWRNNLQTRNMSFDIREVSLEDHTCWFEKSLKSDTRYLYIGMEAGQKIGVCRYDLNLDEQQCEVSINLNPLHRGKGLAKPFLRLSMKKFLTLHTVPVLARIKRDNTSSIQVFESCGYKQSPFDDGALLYIYS